MALPAIRACDGDDAPCAPARRSTSRVNGDDDDDEDDNDDDDASVACSTCRSATVVSMESGKEKTTAEGPSVENRGSHLRVF